MESTAVVEAAAAAVQAAVQACAASQQPPLAAMAIQLLADCCSQLQQADAPPAVGKP